MSHIYSHNNHKLTPILNLFHHCQKCLLNIQLECSSVVEVTVTNSERDHPNLVMKWFAVVGLSKYGNAYQVNLKVHFS